MKRMTKTRGKRMKATKTKPSRTATTVVRRKTSLRLRVAGLRPSQIEVCMPAIEDMANRIQTLVDVSTLGAPPNVAPCPGHARYYDLRMAIRSLRDVVVEHAEPEKVFTELPADVQGALMNVFGQLDVLEAEDQ
jgi:hypothetical protein